MSAVVNADGEDHGGEGEKRGGGDDEEKSGRDRWWRFLQSVLREPSMLIE